MSQKNIFSGNKITEILNLQKFQRGGFVDSTNSDEEWLVISNKEIKTVKNNFKTNNPNINKNIKSNSTKNINSNTYPLLFGCSYKSSLNQTKYNNIILYEKKISDINNQKNNEKLLYFKSNLQTGKNFFMLISQNHIVHLLQNYTSVKLSMKIFMKILKLAKIKKKKILVVLQKYIFQLYFL